MKTRSILFVTVFALTSIGCGSGNDNPATDEAASSRADAEVADDMSNSESTTETMTTESGLKIDVIEQGEGEEAEAGNTAVVHYTGWLYDESADDNRGNKFDSSRDRGQTFEFPLGAGRVIRGWDEGVAGMKVGERRILTLPPELGYGARGAGAAIPPNATLIFDVELIDIK